MFGYVNKLNLTLQGKGESLAVIRKEVKSFQAKLQLYRDDLRSKELECFPTLKDYNSEADLSEFVDFVGQLINEFDSRFAVFDQCDNLLLMVKNPFVVEVSGPWVSQAKSFYPDVVPAALKTELIDIQSDDELLKSQRTNSAEDFWIKCVPSTCSNLKSVAIRVLGIFGTMCICESAFSNMNYIKNKYRSKLTSNHLNDILRISSTSYTLNFGEITRSGRCHFSH